MAKPHLATHISSLMLDQQTSCAALARELDIQYDRLKRSLKGNVFSAEDISKLCQHFDLTAKDFVFRQLGPYRGRSAGKHGYNVSVPGVSEANLELIANNELLATRITELIESECDQFRQWFEERKGAT